MEQGEKTYIAAVVRGALIGIAVAALLYLPALERLLQSPSPTNGWRPMFGALGLFLFLFSFVAWDILLKGLRSWAEPQKQPIWWWYYWGCSVATMPLLIVVGLRMVFMALFP